MARRVTLELDLDRLDHKAPSADKAFGIPSDRAVEISMALVQTIKQSERLSQVVEKILSDEGLEPVEKVFLLVYTGIFLCEMKHAPLKLVIKSLAEEYDDSFIA